MLGARKIIHEVNRRRKVGIVADHRNVLGGIVTIEGGPLNTGTNGQIEFLVLDPPGQGNLIGVLGELIGIAEQAVKGSIALQGIHIIIGIVDRRAVRIGMAVI